MARDREFGEFGAARVMNWPRGAMRVLALGVVLLVSGRASADDPQPDAQPEPTKEEHAASPVRKPDATVREMFHGPFQSSRLYTMPTADTIGAYMLTLSGDGSLLQQPGVLTSAGVLAIGFGDIAQLEYRHTAAISVTGVDAPLPAVGVQLKLPIPERPGVPAIGVAFRLGVSRAEQFGPTEVDEKVTDLFMVVRERIPGVPRLTLHAGVRVSPANITLSGDPTRPDGHFSLDRTLTLPTGGLELAVNNEARVVAEVAAAPQFMWMPGMAADPKIGYGMLGRLGLRWSILPALTLDSSFGYQIENGDMIAAGNPRNVVQQWDIRLGAEVFVPWGALACRAIGAFCD